MCGCARRAAAGVPAAAREPRREARAGRGARGGGCGRFEGGDILMDRLIDQRVTDYLDALASAAPTPGGGSASALAAAMGAAMVVMACNLTVGREQFQAVEAELRAVQAQATAAQQDLAAAVDDDTAAYDAVSLA